MPSLDVASSEGERALAEAVGGGAAGAAKQKNKKPKKTEQVEEMVPSTMKESLVR